ncbi:YmfQ family protein [Varunaivibrio sulfuroxidans]|uniref:Uncharacterized protein YmfQ (DUF2313 family) n=1 Tax=Varunaivibrio sulfuroxidans TaxID=1773489 RepID=A0A4R3JBW1_9PROT|nr:putative phage tail protein [Varunaivibrio sulfuroxidans]TCS62596.1 uncharacterized protein YmfQ (DUF2313 family) [Varunaivibrio sulfuroxidans]WES30735.1 DUF2313 domain-containing protein [Varunaivibrio sulfuroxidans]
MMDKSAYLDQLQQLLPPGAAWPREPAATLTRLLAAMADGLADADGRAGDLIDEDDPRTTLEMLADWERVAGLPDKCAAGAAVTIQQRRAALTAALTARGGQSRQYFIDLAATLGYAVTIVEHGPFQAGLSAAGAPVSAEQWRFVFTVAAPAATVRDFRAGLSAADEPLRTWGNKPMECAITADKPAHAYVIFTYGG